MTLIKATSNDDNNAIGHANIDGHAIRVDDDSVDIDDIVVDDDDGDEEEEEDFNVVC